MTFLYGTRAAVALMYLLLQYRLVCFFASNTSSTITLMNPFSKKCIFSLMYRSSSIECILLSPNLYWRCYGVLFGSFSGTFRIIFPNFSDHFLELFGSFSRTLRIILPNFSNHFTELFGKFHNKSAGSGKSVITFKINFSLGFTKSFFRSKLLKLSWNNFQMEVVPVKMLFNFLTDRFPSILSSQNHPINNL